MLEMLDFQHHANSLLIAIVVGIQVWMLKRINECSHWQAARDVLCEQHRLREAQLERQMPSVLSMMRDHGKEMETIRQNVIRLEQKIADGITELRIRFDKHDEFVRNSVRRKEDDRQT